MENLKVLISGTSGSGKTKLAKYISMRYDIPLVQVSIMDIAKTYKIKNHKELIIRSMREPDFGRKIQKEFLEERQHIFHKYPSFVSDRSILDNLVYFFMQVAPYVTDNDWHEFRNMAGDATPFNGSDVLQVVLMPNLDVYEIEDDGVRIANKAFQQQVALNYEYALKKGFWWLLKSDNFKVKTIREYDWATRVAIIDNLIKLQKKKKWQEKLNLSSIPTYISKTGKDLIAKVRG